MGLRQVSQRSCKCMRHGTMSLRATLAASTCMNKEVGERKNGATAGLTKELQMHEAWHDVLAGNACNASPCMYKEVGERKNGASSGLTKELQMHEAWRGVQAGNACSASTCKYTEDGTRTGITNKLELQLHEPWHDVLAGNICNGHLQVHRRWGKDMSYKQAAVA
eukprot:1157943-Pelagomonas_calceolata.AAC.1